MINLLPDGVKHNITFARRNTKMRRWIGAFVVSILGIALITAFGLFYIHQNINNYTSQINETQQKLDAQHLSTVQKQVQSISDSLKLVVQVLSREVLFSKLISQVATSIPKNAVLTDLDISKTEGGIDLTAAAKDYNTATQFQVNLADPANKIFDKADIVNISCGKAGAGNTIAIRYPCTIIIRAQFAKTNPFLFINIGSKK